MQAIRHHMRAALAASVQTAQRHKEVSMTLGPLEYTVIGFEGNRFDGSIADELQRVVDRGIIRSSTSCSSPRTPTARLDALELDNKDDARFARLRPPARGHEAGLLHAGGRRPTSPTTCPSNTSALVLLFEHRWAVHVKRAIIDAGGFLVSRDHHRARGPGDAQRRARGRGGRGLATRSTRKERNEPT